MRGADAWSNSAGRVLGDPDIVRPSELKHPVQGDRTDGDFRGLGLVRTRSKDIADHAFASADRGLDFGPINSSPSSFTNPSDRAQRSPGIYRSRCLGAIAADAPPETAVEYGTRITWVRMTLVDSFVHPCPDRSHRPP